MGTPVRLQRYLAAAGVAARRKAEELITAGRVMVNGEVVRVLGTKVDPDRDEVQVDGEAVVALDTFYVLFNKPKGCITAVTDDRGRPTVMDYLPNLPVPVKPVGRLDFYSEGVLLLTNDGELAARLLAPASHVPKTYHVKVHGRLTEDDLEQLREGVRLDDGTTTMPAGVQLLPGESKHTWIAVTIHEGKHRQIHRMVEALGHRVDKLQRVAFANLTFHNLRIGDARELTQQELNELRDMVGLDHSTVARGAWLAHREDTDIPRRARAKARAEAEASQLDLDLPQEVDPTDPATRVDDLDDWSLDDGDRAYPGEDRPERAPDSGEARRGRGRPRNEAHGRGTRGGDADRGGRGGAGARRGAGAGDRGRFERGGRGPGGHEDRGPGRAGGFGEGSGEARRGFGTRTPDRGFKAGAGRGARSAGRGIRGGGPEARGGGRGGRPEARGGGRGGRPGGFGGGPGGRGPGDRRGGPGSRGPGGRGGGPGSRGPGGRGGGPGSQGPSGSGDRGPGGPGSRGPGGRSGGPGNRGGRGGGRAPRGKARRTKPRRAR
jgi:pseudouridine synthase